MPRHRSSSSGSNRAHDLFWVPDWSFETTPTADAKEAVVREPVGGKVSPVVAWYGDLEPRRSTSAHVAGSSRATVVAPVAHGPAIIEVAGELRQRAVPPPREPCECLHNGRPIRERVESLVDLRESDHDGAP